MGDQELHPFDAAIHERMTLASNIFAGVPVEILRDFNHRKITIDPREVERLEAELATEKHLTTVLTKDSESLRALLKEQS